MLRHFVAENQGGTEFMSVCPEHIKNVGPKCMEARADQTFPHKTCDLCEMLTQGRLPAREAQLAKEGIIVYPSSP